uniref:Uncharacterized protein n=1 Tax=Vitrella brassicaformis TaxID=1169539 RepID=A0A7S1K1X9_9ALVE|mmetsp:Transcript_33890/g.83769  ORF Transcript_33890/g.83769 Transcript_33890/m.83769 type:complete len:141 (+) Transcript_33890:77-499(+)
MPISRMRSTAACRYTVKRWGKHSLALLFFGTSSPGHAPGMQPVSMSRLLMPVGPLLSLSVLSISLVAATPNEEKITDLAEFLLDLLAPVVGDKRPEEPNPYVTGDKGDVQLNEAFSRAIKNVRETDGYLDLVNENFPLDV